MEHRRAFTLIELLVVIAIIALLLAILVPSLNLAKRKAAAAVCLVHVKNLALSWYMYQEDNDGRIMSANDDDYGAYEDNGLFVGWIAVPRDASDNPSFTRTQTTPPVTDEDEIRGIEDGRLFEYINAPKAYHCPADKIHKGPDGTTVFVSYSIPECLYGWPDTGHPRYDLQIRKFSEITSPSRRYAFVEARETRNWNAGHHFVMSAPEYRGGTPGWGWWGPIAINHGDSSTLGFCDGHGEVRKWRDEFTRAHVEKLLNGGPSYGQVDPPPEQQSDINYMAAGWPYRHRL